MDAKGSISGHDRTWVHMGGYGSENMGAGRMGATAVEPSAVSATSLLLSELELASI